ncbi:MAG: hypothetical protein ACFCUQ_19830 [Kiloniellales bacterium]
MAPIFSGLVDPLTRLRRHYGVFNNVRLPKKDAAPQGSAAQLIALPEPQLGEQATDRNGGSARLENQRSGMVLRGMVESWSQDSGTARNRSQRTAVFGAEHDLMFEQRRLSLQSEVGLHDSDAASASDSRSLENLGYAFRLSGEEPSGRVSYGVAFDYRGAGFRPDAEVGYEARGRFNGAWRLDDATRLSGYIGRSARELGTENPYDGWSAGFAMERAMLPALLPGLTAELGLEGSRVGNAQETEDLLRSRARLALRAPLAPDLRGRMAVIADREQEQIQSLSRQGRELRFGLEQDFELLGAATRLAGEASLRTLSGSDVANDTGTAGLSFTLNDGDNSLTLRGRLLQHENYRTPENSGLGSELAARVLHLGSGYSAGLETALHDSPHAVPADYRAGLFVNLPF